MYINIHICIYIYMWLEDLWDVLDSAALGTVLLHQAHLDRDYGLRFRV